MQTYQPVGNIENAQVRRNLEYVSASLFSLKSEMEAFIAANNGQSGQSISTNVVITNPGYTDRNRIQPLGLGANGLVLKAPLGTPTANAFEVRNSSDVVQARINWSGVITSATWQGGTVGAAYGGTGFSSYTTGDLLYASGATTLSQLAIGGAGAILNVTSGLPAWLALGAANRTPGVNAGATAVEWKPVTITSAGNVDGVVELTLSGDVHVADGKGIVTNMSGVVDKDAITLERIAAGYYGMYFGGFGADVGPNQYIIYQVNSGSVATHAARHRFLVNDVEMFRVGNAIINMYAATVNIGALTGTGTRIVVADASGNLSTTTATFITTATLGDIIYASAANVWSNLAGNTTATLNILTQTGTGAVSAAPAWSTLAAASIPSGTGTNNTVAKWTGTNTQGDSSITDTGALVTISVSTDISGQVRTTGKIGTDTYFSTGDRTTPNTNSGIDIRNSNLTSASQYGISSNLTFSSSATTLGHFANFGYSTAAAAFTMPEGVSINIYDPIKGAGSSITNNYAVKVDDQSSGTNNWVWYSGTGKFRIADDFNSDATTDASSTTTGSLQTDGGLGVVKKLYVGDAASFAGKLGIATYISTGDSTVPNTNTAIDVRNSNLTGTAQYGLLANQTFSSGATTSGYFIYAGYSTAAASFTMATGAAIRIYTPAIGAGSAVTTNYGLYIENQTGGGTNYAIYTNTGDIRFGDTATIVGMLTADGGITLNAGDNIVLATSTGTKIGTGTTQLLGFWNATPVDQPAHIADPSGGATQDAEARTAINAINAMLAETGLTAAA